MLRLLLIGVLLCAPAVARAVDLTVYAAASLGGALDDIAEAWEADTGGDVTLVYAGSSALVRQIDAGAEADVVLLASVDWMDELDRRGRLQPGTRRALLGNRLVVIGSWIDTDPLEIAEPGALRDRLGRGRLALALTEAVPAGIYAREALEHLDVWESVADRVVESDNVRTALALVARRAAHLGIVYATDAEVDARVAIVAEIPASSHAPIIYPAAQVAGASEPASTFLAFLESPIARAIWTGHGFSLRPQVP